MVPLYCVNKTRMVLLEINDQRNNFHIELIVKRLSKLTSSIDQLGQAQGANPILETAKAIPRRIFATNKRSKIGVSCKTKTNGASQF